MMERIPPETLVQAICELRTHAVRQESELESELERLHPTHAAGGRNPAHYLAVRQHDPRELQPALAALGLSEWDGRARRKCLQVARSGAQGALGACDGASANCGDAAAERAVLEALARR
jgi:pyruvate kinase